MLEDVLILREVERTVDQKSGKLFHRELEHVVWRLALLVILGPDAADVAISTFFKFVNLNLNGLILILGGNLTMFMLVEKSRNESHDTI